MTSEKDDWILNTDGALALPRSVRDLILERLERLAPAERRLLDLVAVIGDGTPHSILRAASGIEEEALLHALRSLRAKGLVIERMDGSNVSYSITHPLIQEVAYSELPQMERRRLHLMAIEAIDLVSDGRNEDLSHLARHFHGAGPEATGDRALAVLLAAGERALSRYANEEAAGHYAAALSMIRESEGWGGTLSTLHPPPSTLSEVLERLGEAWERIGERREAIKVWSEALIERDQANPSPGRTIAASRLRCRLAMAEWDRGRFEVANSHLRTVLSLLAGHEPCQELADLHYTRFNIQNRLGDEAGAASTAAELLRLAEQLASPRSEAEANLAAAISYLWQGDVANARQRALHALTVSESFPDGPELALCCRAHTVLISIGMRLGDHRSMRYHAERGLAVTNRLGAPDMDILLHLRLAYANFMSGAWEESLTCSTQAVALARRVGHPRDLAFSLAVRALILAMRGGLPEAEACIAEARSAFGSPSGEGPVDRSVFGVIDMAETALAIERGQSERAIEFARRFVRSRASPDVPVGLTPAPMSMGYALLAEAQVMAGDLRGALETSGMLLGLGPPGALYLTALATRVEGLARRGLGQQQ
ncbi:MAG: hypothetical protein Q7R39_15625, partial [Dehalococcoidia bacterium]|nr:hypothetical protein [Dehalococcoidia bacterium]